MFFHSWPLSSLNTMPAGRPSMEPTTCAAMLSLPSADLVGLRTTFSEPKLWSTPALAAAAGAGAGAAGVGPAVTGASAAGALGAGAADAGAAADGAEAAGMAGAVAGAVAA